MGHDKRTKGGSRVGKAVPPPNAPPASAADGVLVRFGELGIKSPPVRRAMLENLRLNLLAAMEHERVEGDVMAIGSRLWMVGSDPDALAAVATRTFGVVSASPVRKVAANLASIGQAAIEAAASAPKWTSFAMRATREGTHLFSSQEVQTQVGATVWKAAVAAGRTPKVDLSKPDLEIFVDIRNDKAFVFTKVLDGPGGIPVGCQGHGLALLSDENSFLAAWLMMRRGCAVTGLHAGDTGSIAIDAVAELARWGLDPNVELLPVCSGTTSKTALIEASARVAEKRGAQVLITGDTIDSSLLPCRVPVLRPLAGLDRLEVQRVRDRARLPAIHADDILDESSSETPESLLQMRRTVSP